MKNILVTGGAGYIGSHTCIELLNAGFNLFVIDNLCNGSEISLQRVKKITNRSLTFIKGDIRNSELVYQILTKNKIHAVIHFAGLKSVEESCNIPLDYYNNNIYGTLVLCEQMKKANISCLVFSSSATVYGNPHQCPIDENFPLSSTNPYGRSKLFIEEILKDLTESDSNWKIALLRYFNPVGAHESGMIGENPLDIPNNLMPYISQVAIGKLRKLSIFGHDYPTKDGTGVRDYIHVVDLSIGHIKALETLQKSSGIHIWNLGIGHGYSVLEIIKYFEKVTKRNIPFQFTNRRKGDIATCYANPSKSMSELNWKASRNLETIIKDTWRWQTQNPKGYQ